MKRLFKFLLPALIIATGEIIAALIVALLK